jgi:hypothetical protein
MQPITALLASVLIAALSCGALFASTSSTSALALAGGCGIAIAVAFAALSMLALRWRRGAGYVDTAVESNAALYEQLAAAFDAEARGGSAERSSSSVEAEAG